MESAGACSSPVFTFKEKKDLIHFNVKKQDPADEAVGGPDPSPIKSVDLGEKGDIPGTPPELIMAAPSMPGAPRAMRKEFPKVKGSRRVKAVVFDSGCTDRYNAHVAASEAYLRKYRISGLPRLFDSLLDSFQGRTFMAKEKLVDNISVRHDYNRGKSFVMMCQGDTEPRVDPHKIIGS